MDKVITVEQAWNLILAAAKKQEYQADTDNIASGKHPFVEKIRATYCGCPGVSDSVGTLINAVMAELILVQKNEVNFTLWLAPAGEINGNDVIAEVEIIYDETYSEHFLCGGLTDYSGTGGAALVQVKTWMTALDALINTDNPRGITERYISQVDLKNFYDLQNKAVSIEGDNSDCN